MKSFVENVLVSNLGLFDIILLTINFLLTPGLKLVFFVTILLGISTVSLYS